MFSPMAKRFSILFYISNYTCANHGVFSWHDEGPMYETLVYNTRQNQQIYLRELKINKAFSHRHTDSVLGVSV